MRKRGEVESKFVPSKETNKPNATEATASNSGKKRDFIHKDWADKSKTASLDGQKARIIRGKIDRLVSPTPEKIVPIQQIDQAPKQKSLEGQEGRIRTARLKEWFKRHFTNPE